MKIKDDGKSFQMKNIPFSKGRKRLGLLGMRERVEMVGGSFDVNSSPGHGTAIVAQIPFARPVKKRKGPMQGVDKKAENQ